MTDYLYIIIGMSTSFVLCIAVLLFYIKYRKNIVQQQYQMKIAEIEHQKTLIHSIITSQEMERKRIGMDLHDDIGASLSAIKLMLQMNANVTQELDEVIQSVRNLSHNLYPTIKGQLGFSDALHEYVDKINQSNALYIEVEFKNDKCETFLKDDAALGIYRILTELINNSIKHGQAQLINIIFDMDDIDFTIEYKDDGVGQLPQKLKHSSGMGFNNINSRLGIIKGKMTIEDPEVGCQIILKIPVHGA